MILIVQPVNTDVIENEVPEPAVEPVEMVTGEHFQMTQEQYEVLVTYFEIETGALIELTWLIKSFIIMFIIIQGWRLVRK